MSDNRWSDDPERTFDRMVGPALSSLEQERVTAIDTSRRRYKIGSPIAIGLLALIGYFIWNVESSWIILIVAAVFLGIGMVFWANGPRSKFENQLRDTVMDAVCQHIGDLTYKHAVSSSDFPVNGFSDASIVPSHASARLEDLLEGTYRGCRFALVEAKLKSGGKNKKTVFEGLLLTISLPRAVSAQITIAPDTSDKGSFGRSIVDWWMPGDRVDVPHEAFENKYDVYSKDPQTTLSVITRDFVSNFMALPKVLKSDKILAAFTEDMFLVSVADTPSFLDDFKAAKPVTEYRDLFGQITEETQVIHRVIDQLLEGDRYAERA